MSKINHSKSKRPARKMENNSPTKMNSNLIKIEDEIEIKHENIEDHPNSPTSDTATSAYNLFDLKMEEPITIGQLPTTSTALQPAKFKVSRTKKAD